MTQAPVSGFIPETGERAFIGGQTGSGKTAFAVHIMLRIPIAPIVIYDTKDEEKFLSLPNHRVVETMEQAALAYHDVTIDYIIIRPNVELLGKPELLDDMLFYHYMHFHHSVAYIDEAGMFHNGARAYKGLIALMSRGRSRGITTIASTQRPRGISRLLLTESQRFYVFRFADLDDRKRISDVIPDFAKEPLPPKHGFYYFQSGEDAPILFQPVKLDKQFDTGYVDVPKVDSQPEGDDGEAPPLPHIWL